MQNLSKDHPSQRPGFWALIMIEARTTPLLQQYFDVAGIFISRKDLIEMVKNDQHFLYWYWAPSLLTQRYQDNRKVTKAEHKGIYRSIRAMEKRLIQESNY